MMIRRRQWQKSPVTGESAEETVKTIAQGRPDVTGEPVATTRVLSTIAHGATGAPSTRLSLRPLYLRDTILASLGRNRVARAFVYVSAL
jgi:hypothetical protein